jgi:hypothetical protein
MSKGSLSLLRCDPLPHAKYTFDDAEYSSSVAIVQLHYRLFDAAVQALTIPTLAVAKTARGCLVVTSHLTTRATKLHVRVCICDVSHELKVRTFALSFAKTPSGAK